MEALALHLDLESRSRVDLTKAGAYRYALDPSTEIMLGSGCFSNNNDVRHWIGDQVPASIRNHVAKGRIIKAHNAAFERVMLASKGLHVPPDQMDCTMARARACGLPGALFLAARALGSPEGKDLDGHRLMMKLCRPAKDGSWHEDPADIEALAAYCDQDVRTEMAIDAILPPLSERERRIWVLDQIINDRGVKLDRPMIEKALSIVDIVLEAADAEIRRLTGGAVEKVTQARRIVAWLQSRHIPCESVAEGKQEDLIVGAEVLDDPDAKAVVELRGATAKAFKFKTMLDMICPDDRVRGSLVYCGTIQKRWAGSGVQFHNMKRVETEEDAVAVGAVVNLLHSGKTPARIVGQMAVLDSSPLGLLSICTRSTVIAEKGHRLVGGDYSNIEGRINAWLAGQTDKLAAFRRYDEGTGPDLYRVTAGRIIGIPTEQVTKAQRQEQGKVPELACGYQGSVGAFAKMGAKYGVRLPDSQVKVIVQGWREANWKIVESWAILQQAAIDAVEARGCVVEVLDGKVAYVADKKFLYCRLPSGGYIHYPFPSVAWKTKTIKVDGDEIAVNRKTVSFWGQHNGRPVNLDLYGGMQCAHVVSGIAREVLADSMLNAEAAGYPIVLTIHDELLCEVPRGRGLAEGLKEIMLRPIPWLKGCPIAASTWEGPRYVK